MNEVLFKLVNWIFPPPFYVFMYVKEPVFCLFTRLSSQERLHIICS